GGDDRGVQLFKQVDHLFHTWNRRVDDVVAEHNAKRLTSDRIARDKDRVPEPERFLLSHIGHVNHVRDLPHLIELVLLTPSFEYALEFVRNVKMILDRILSPTGHNRDVAHPGRDRFLNDVLNQRLVYERQHLFWLSFCGREEPSS